MPSPRRAAAASWTHLTLWEILRRRSKSRSARAAPAKEILDTFADVLPSIHNAIAAELALERALLTDLEAGNRDSLFGAQIRYALQKLHSGA